MKSRIVGASAVVALSFALSGAAVAGEEPVDSLAILRRTLNEPGVRTISLVNTRAGREIRYCPDSTCDIFKAARSVPHRVLADFAFTYIFYASGYTYLRDFVTRTGRPYVTPILDRNGSECPKQEELQQASCVLRSLAKRYSIQSLFVRYDEGTRVDVAVDLDSAVAVSELTRRRAWQLEQWRKHP